VTRRSHHQSIRTQNGRLKRTYNKCNFHQNFEGGFKPCFANRSNTPPFGIHISTTSLINYTPHKTHKLMDTLSQSSNSPTPRLESRKYTLTTIAWRLSYYDILPLVKNEHTLPSNLAAILDHRPTFVLVSRLLLPSHHKTATFGPRKLDFIQDSGNISPALPKFISTSLPLHMIQYFTRRTKRQPTTASKASKNLADSQWEVIEYPKPLLKWKCVSHSPKPSLRSPLWEFIEALTS
jgi:hypothetical protein